MNIIIFLVIIFAAIFSFFCVVFLVIYKKKRNKKQNHEVALKNFTSMTLICENEGSETFTITSAKASFENGLLTFTFETNRFFLKINPLFWRSRVQKIKKHNTGYTFKNQYSEVKIETTNQDFVHFLDGTTAFLHKIKVGNLLKDLGIFWRFTTNKWTASLEYAKGAPLCEEEVSSYLSFFEKGTIIPDPKQWSVLKNLLRWEITAPTNHGKIFDTIKKD